MSGQPSTSIFVQNLNDSVVKKEEMRRSLYTLFSMYGKVLDVVHTRKTKVRGTAFVVFRDLASSTNALRGLDGEAFFGRQLKLSYARTVSHAAIAHAEGPEAVFAIKAGLRSAAEKAANSTSKLTVSAAQKRLEEDGKKKRARDDAEEEEEESEEEDGPDRKKGRNEDEDEDDAMMEESDEEAPGPAGAS